MVDTPAPPPARNALEELRRRKVVQWSLAYVAAVWGLLQGLGFAVSTFHWPEPAMRVAAILAVVGLPITVTLAWYHGDRGAQRVARGELLILAVLLAIGAIAVRQAARAPAESASNEGARTAVPAPRAQLDRHRVAILPFDNLGSDPANAAFVGGVHDTLITLVAKVPGLSVISRSSVLQFAGMHPTIGAVAAALGVGAVLEGSVQRAGNRLRVQAQLIDARTDTHLWAETYDRSADDLFAVQSEIAQAVAEQLRTRLTSDETHQIATRLTKKPDAYEHYVLGRNFMTHEQWPESIRELTLAVTFDPEFASAQAQLGMARTWQAFYDPETGKDDLPLARAAVDRALDLDPTLPEGHLALALYLYRGEPDLDRAAGEFERAVAGLPNDATAHQYFGYLRRWQGRMEEASALFARAAELDPRGESVKNYILSLVSLGQREAAAKAIVGGQAARPDDVELALWPGDLVQNFACDLHAMEHVLQDVGQRFPNNPTVLIEKWFFAVETNDPAGAVDAVERAAASTSGPPDEDLPWRRGLAYLSAGRRAEAERNLKSSLDWHLRRSRSLPQGELRANQFAWAALIYALLADSRRAVVHANLAVAELARNDHGPDRTDTLLFSAAALARSGRSDAAIPLVRAIFLKPSILQPSGVWCDPLLAPLRADPRYRSMMAGLGADVSVDPYRRDTWPRQGKVAAAMDTAR